MRYLLLISLILSAYTISGPVSVGPIRRGFMFQGTVMADRTCRPEEILSASSYGTGFGAATFTWEVRCRDNRILSCSGTPGNIREHNTGMFHSFSQDPIDSHGCEEIRQVRNSRTLTSEQQERLTKALEESRNRDSNE